MFVDLHLHSSASDGTLSPRELAQEACRHGLAAFALADHNTTAGLEGLLAGGWAEPGNPRLLSGVELDAWHAGQSWHVLGYGFDWRNVGLQALCRRNRQNQEAVNRRVVLGLEGERPGLTAAYDQYTPSEPGGWRLLHFLRAQGLADTLHGGLRYYGLTGAAADERTFPSVAEAAAVLHAAGGVALLAHPGADIAAPVGSPAFWAALDDLLAQGLDGVECFHPTTTRRWRPTLWPCANGGACSSPAGPIATASSLPAPSNGWAASSCRRRPLRPC